MSRKTPPRFVQGLVIYFLLCFVLLYSWCKFFSRIRLHINFSCIVFSTAEACPEEGGLRLTSSPSGSYKYLQVCHIGEWRYLCEDRFTKNGADSEVVLQQLDCSSGGIVL